MGQVTAVVVGALIAIVGSGIIQLLIVPAADARRRRGERWEESLMGLGERLLFSEQAAAEAVDECHNKVLKSRETYMLSREDAESIWARKGHDTHPWYQGVSDAHDAVNRAEEEHGREVARVDWLVAKVQADAPKGRDLKPLMQAYQAFCDAAVRIRVPFDEVMDFYTYAPLSEAGFDGLAIEMREHAPDLSGARSQLLREIKQLLAGKRLEDEYEEAVKRRDAERELLAAKRREDVFEQVTKRRKAAEKRRRRRRRRRRRAAIRKSESTSGGVAAVLADQGPPPPVQEPSHPVT